MEGVGEPKAEKQGSEVSRNLWTYGFFGQAEPPPPFLILSTIMTNTCIIIFHKCTQYSFCFTSEVLFAGSDFIIGMVKHGKITRWPTVPSRWHTLTLSLVCCDPVFC